MDSVKYRRVSGFILRLCFPLFCFQVWIASAITAHDLRKMMDAGEKVQIVDIRVPQRYSLGHLPGAINIPEAVLDSNHLSTATPIVVYGDGIDAESLTRSLELLRGRFSSEVQSLDGGILAWEEDFGSTGSAAGLNAERFHYVRYDKFIKLLGVSRDIVLLDIRTPARDNTRLNGGPLNRPVISSGSSQRIVVEKQVVSGAIRLRKAQGQRLFIIIGDGSDRAEAVARRLEGAGIRRVAILTGGEIALKTKGASESKTMTSGGQP